MVVSAPTHVILPDVTALAADSEGYVDPVVDEKRDVVSSGDLVQLSGDPYELPSIARLVPELNAGDATSQRGLDDIADISSPKDRWCRVCDEVEPVIYVFFPHHA